MPRKVDPKLSASGRKGGEHISKTIARRRKDFQARMAKPMQENYATLQSATEHIPVSEWVVMNEEQRATAALTRHPPTKEQLTAYYKRPPL